MRPSAPALPSAAAAARAARDPVNCVTACSALPRAASPASPRRLEIHIGRSGSATSVSDASSSAACGSRQQIDRRPPVATGAGGDGRNRCDDAGAAPPRFNVTATASTAAASRDRTASPARGHVQQRPPRRAARRPPPRARAPTNDPRTAATAPARRRPRPPTSSPRSSRELHAGTTAHAARCGADDSGRVPSARSTSSSGCRCHHEDLVAEQLLQVARARGRNSP